MRTCSKCMQEKQASDFYTKDGKVTHYHCRACNAESAADRKREFKRKCVEYKGGICVDCGFKGHQAIFDFHHIDPTKKDLSIGSTSKTRIDDIIKDELDKCILLCANCHRLRHVTG